MKEKDILLQAYQSSSLSAEEEQRMESLIESGEIQLEELDTFRAIMTHFKGEADVCASEKMDKDFYAFLEAKQNKSWKARLFSLKASPFYTVAAAIVLFLIAFWLEVKRQVSVGGKTLPGRF